MTYLLSVFNGREHADQLRSEVLEKGRLLQRSDTTEVTNMVLAPGCSLRRRCPSLYPKAVGPNIGIGPCRKKHIQYVRHRKEYSRCFLYAPGQRFPLITSRNAQTRMFTDSSEA